MKKRFRTLRHRMATHIFRAIVFFVLLTPRWAGVPLIRFLGRCVALLGGRDVERTKQNLLSHASRMTSVPTVGDVFAATAHSFYDNIKLPGYSAKRFQRLVKVYNSEALVRCREQKRGIICLSGHMSAFEIQTHAVKHLGFPVFSVGAKQVDTRIDQQLMKLRCRNGVECFVRDGSAIKILRALRANKVFGVLIDQDTTKIGVFAPFMGELAFTPSGPMELALQKDIPVLHVFLSRDSKGVYHFRISDPIELVRTGNLQEEVALNIAVFNTAYSEHILHYPDQWVWMHRRWKRKRENYPAIPSSTDYPSKEHL